MLLKIIGEWPNATKSAGRGSGQGFKRSLALAGILDVFFQITVGGLDFAAGFLNLSFQFQIVVADKIAGDFLYFALSLFGGAFDPVLVNNGSSPVLKRQRPKVKKAPRRELLSSY